MRRRFLLLFIAAAACAASPPRAPLAASSNRGQPDPDDRALARRVDAVIDDAIAKERVVGAVVMIARHGEIVYHRASGFADREAGRPMREDAIFRYASMSKPIVSLAALALVDAGAIGLDDPVTRWLPEFTPRLRDGRTPPITVRQLLTHTSGLSYGLMEKEDGPYHRAGVSDGMDQPGLSFDENARRMMSVPLRFEPGKAFLYSMSIDILGEVVARAGGAPLPEVVARLVTGPLGMRDTGFSVADRARLATAYADGRPRPVRMDDGHIVRMGDGRIRYAPSRVFDPRSYPSGGAGMVGTAGDFMALLRALNAGGGPVVRPATAAMMVKNQLGTITSPMLGDGRGFGFGTEVLIDPVRASSPMSAGSYRWGGAYGSSWFVDPAAGIIVVAMTNTAVEGMSGQFPDQLEQAVYK